MTEYLGQCVLMAAADPEWTVESGSGLSLGGRSTDDVLDTFPNPPSLGLPRPPSLPSSSVAAARETTGDVTQCCECRARPLSSRRGVHLEGIYIHKCSLYASEGGCIVPLVN